MAEEGRIEGGSFETRYVVSYGVIARSKSISKEPG